MCNERITVLVDNDSWILPYAQQLVEKFETMGFNTVLKRKAEDIQPGWINFMLGCIRIVDGYILKRNQHNLVVHESDLPKGRGFAPMTWQVLQGVRQIPICLLEAVAEVDAGDIWLQDVIELKGHELCDEWRALQGEKTVEMCLRFVADYPMLQPNQQIGAPSIFPRRCPDDSRLDPTKNLRDLFPILRVVDNQRYPAFFEIDGQRYVLKIYKAD